MTTASLPSLASVDLTSTSSPLEISVSMEMMNETTTRYQDTANYSAQLQLANDEMAITLIPAMVVVGVLMLIGFIGNSFVCYVFSRKLRKSTQNYLFVALAAFDLMSCCVAMPTEIVDMRYFFMFDAEIVCKILRFLVTFPSLASNTVLLTIAVDRFRKVCRPLYQQVTRKHARAAVGLASLIAILSSIPALFIYGSRSAPTRFPGIVGTDCSTSDSMKGKIYPLIYESALGVAFFAYTTTLVILYTFIWREIKRHQKYMDKTTTFALLLLRERSGESDHSSTPATPRSRSQSHDLTNATPKPSAPSYRGHRTTMIAFLVTFVFILSYLPHLVLIIARIIKKDFDHNIYGAKLVLYNIFLRSYFVNAMANPIIYGAMNYEFRSECVKVIKKLCFCFCDSGM